MRGHREDKRRDRLDAENRCRRCAGKLAYAEIGVYHYCLACRGAVEVEVWRRHCDGEAVKRIAVQVQRSPSVVSEIVHRLKRSGELETTAASIPVRDNIPRCRCGLRIDKDHLVCDLYGAVQFADQRRGAGPTYPGNGWRGDE